MHIHVVAQSIGAGGNDIPVAGGKVKVGGKININTAGKSELDLLPGVGPALAAAIVEYRQNNGSFNDIEGLKKVPGIGPSKFEKLKDKITL